MNERRNEEPLTTADIANRQRAGKAPGTAVIDETDVDGMDGSDRVTPANQSVAANDTNDTNGGASDTGDTYDGEIVSSTAEPIPQSNLSSSSGRQNLNQQAARASRSGSATPSKSAQNRSDSPLFAENELRDFRARWDQVQTSFVDEPRRAVEQADTLVATVVKRIAEQFSEERAKLEQQWDRGGDVSTEDLRQNFQRYRTFFDRLLTF